MANEYKGFTVVFESDLHEDYVNKLKDTIELLKGVKEVKNIETVGEDYINRSMVKSELIRKIYEVLK